MLPNVNLAMTSIHYNDNFSCCYKHSLQQVCTEYESHDKQCVEGQFT
jgi:hypothetical protein